MDKSRREWGRLKVQSIDSYISVDVLDKAKLSEKGKSGGKTEIPIGKNKSVQLLLKLERESELINNA